MLSSPRWVMRGRRTLAQAARPTCDGRTVSAPSHARRARAVSHARSVPRWPRSTEPFHGISRAIRPTFASSGAVRYDSHEMKLRRQVIVVGGGFGGLNLARALARAPVHVTLLDRQNHHLFQPLLYQVAMAGLAPGEVAVPIRGVLRLQDNVRVLLSDVTDIDLDERLVRSREMPPLEYDYLVIASGAENSYFGHDDWQPVAPGLKDIDEALEIRRRVLLAFEAAEREPDPGVQRKHLTFVVIGGGPTGVELAGAIAELATFVLARDFRAIRSDATRVVLIEGGPRILASFPE